jgi:hypothetical protein
LQLRQLHVALRDVVSDAKLPSVNSQNLTRMALTSGLGLRPSNLPDLTLRWH